MSHIQIYIDQFIQYVSMIYSRIRSLSSPEAWVLLQYQTRLSDIPSTPLP